MKIVFPPLLVTHKLIDEKLFPRCQAQKENGGDGGGGSRVDELSDDGN